MDRSNAAPTSEAIYLKVLHNMIGGLIMKSSAVLCALQCVVFGNVFITPSFAAEERPPNLYEYFVENLALPTPIAPVGLPIKKENISDVTFEWTQINSADAYTLWIQEDNGRKFQVIFKGEVEPTATSLVPETEDSENTQELVGENFECQQSMCKASGISLNGTAGQWWVQALNITGSKKSRWSKAGIFGTKGDLYSRCVKTKQGDHYAIEAGDLPWLRNEMSDLTRGEWTVGLAALAQAIKYDFAKKKAGFNNSVGAGASFRFYRDVYVPGEQEKVPISRIRTECRVKTFQLRDDADLPEAGPTFSITPVIFASQLPKEGELRVEPAIMLGFFEDIVNIGGGFNLTGEDGDVGDVFLLFSIGVGFNW